MNPPLLRLWKIARHWDLDVRFDSTDSTGGPSYIPATRKQRRYRENLRGYIELGDPRPIEFARNPKWFEERVAKNLAHELGHFLIAPPGRRYRRDYGIPPIGGRTAEMVIKWDLDEAKAILVEHFLYRRCGFRFRIPKEPLGGVY